MDDILRHALEAVDPARAVKRHLLLESGRLRVGKVVLSLDQAEKVWVIGGGKAGRTMATAVEALLGERVTAGLVNVKPEAAGRTPRGRIALHPAGHPIPSADGVEGARAMASLLGKAGRGDLVLCLLSGGASALLTWPAEGISLDDYQALTQALLQSGAPIGEVNCVRKHCSRLGGGQLARVAGQARLVTLCLSDVVGDPPEVIGSGPTVPDGATFADAWAVLERHELLDRVPATVRARLERGRRGEVEETPKAGDPAFERAHYVLVGRNLDACRAAARRSEELGYRSLVLTTRVEGEAREIGRAMAGLALGMLGEGLPLPAPGCVLAGGETTVTVRGHGLGGRNTELALAAALALAGEERAMVVSFASDGIDGPTEGAGAMAGGASVPRARRLGLDPVDYLQRNDSYRFFEPLGDIIRVGPTETNVNDLILVLAH